MLACLLLEAQLPLLGGAGGSGGGGSFARLARELRACVPRFREWAGESSAQHQIFNEWSSFARPSIPLPVDAVHISPLLDGPAVRGLTLGAAERGHASAARRLVQIDPEAATLTEDDCWAIDSPLHQAASVWQCGRRARRLTPVRWAGCGASGSRALRSLRCAPGRAYLLLRSRTSSLAAGLERAAGGGRWPGGALLHRRGCQRRCQQCCWAQESRACRRPGAACRRAARSPVCPSPCACCSTQPAAQGGPRNANCSSAAAAAAGTPARRRTPAVVMPPGADCGGRSGAGGRARRRRRAPAPNCAAPTWQARAARRRARAWAWTPSGAAPAARSGALGWGVMGVGGWRQLVLAGGRLDRCFCHRRSTLPPHSGPAGTATRRAAVQTGSRVTAACAPLWAPSERPPRPQPPPSVSARAAPAAGVTPAAAEQRCVCCRCTGCCLMPLHSLRVTCTALAHQSSQLGMHRPASRPAKTPPLCAACARKHHRDVMACATRFTLPPLQGRQAATGQRSLPCEQGLGTRRRQRRASAGQAAGWAPVQRGAPACQRVVITCLRSWAASWVDRAGPEGRGEAQGSGSAQDHVGALAGLLGGSSA